MSKTGGKRHPVMEIRISGLPDGEFPFEFDAPASEIDLESFKGNIQVRGTLRRVSSQLTLLARVHGTYVAECDRCLAETVSEIDVPMELYYHVTVPGERTAAGEEDTEIRLFQPDQDSIDLDEEVRQTLLLEVPLKTLCGPDCKGLCPGCGADLNREECRCTHDEIDPRWAKLAEAFKKTDEN